jgi:hypothetical protein
LLFAVAIASVAVGGGLGFKGLFGPRPVVIAGDNPTWGEATAPVTIYEFSDYG